MESLYQEVGKHLNVLEKEQKRKNKNKEKINFKNKTFENNLTHIKKTI